MKLVRRAARDIAQADGATFVLRDGPVDSAELHQGLSTIEKNALQQLKIVNDLVDSSLIVLGRFQLQKEPVNISRSIQHALKNLDKKIEEKKVRVTFIDLLPNAYVIGDEKRLEQIFRH